MENIPKICRAMVIKEYGKPYEIQEFPVTDVEPGGLLVKVEMAGICGTDIHQWEGEVGIKPALPFIPGHESVGRIIKMGEGKQLWSLSREQNP